MGAGKRRRAQKAVRDQLDTSGHLYDGCPTCDAIKEGDEEAMLAAMFRQPEPGEHRVLWTGDDEERTYLVLMAHGEEWVGEVTDEHPVGEWERCPVCDEPVPTGADARPW